MGSLRRIYHLNLRDKLVHDDTFKINIWCMVKMLRTGQNELHLNLSNFKLNFVPFYS